MEIKILNQQCWLGEDNKIRMFYTIPQHGNQVYGVTIDCVELGISDPYSITAEQIESIKAKVIEQAQTDVANTEARKTFQNQFANITIVVED